MATGFKSTPKGFSARFSEDEAELLKKLADDVVLALEADQDPEADPLAAMVGISENATIPQDAAVARMLPVASDDPEVADEFRRFTELTLRQQKKTHLALLAYDVLALDVELDREHAQAWAAALNDIRLTLGSRLEINSEDDAAQVAEFTSVAEVETVEEYMSVIYNFVTWLQDTLMEAMLTELEA